jgi:hypothetical protein
MRTTVFKFSAGEKPLRSVLSGDHRFVPIIVPKPKAITCRHGHALSETYTYQECHRCRAYCAPWSASGRVEAKGCERAYQENYFVCAVCIAKLDETARKAALNPAGKPTYLRLEPPTSLTLQLPPSSHAPASAAADLRETTQLFTFAVELRIDLLPPAEQHLVLLRFSDVATARSRQKNVPFLPLFPPGRSTDRLADPPRPCPPNAIALVAAGREHLCRLARARRRERSAGRRGLGTGFVRGWSGPPQPADRCDGARIGDRSSQRPPDR